ncbi:hypothetical protein J8281_12055 [Aquimarina sp. U1-2]|uniref:hypothetical protein n=1 Tax=Aquimarina sp. U1-2 TaxID=2823141 RepID=UPI001AECB136|nr:hypothetical protein [Aquimarina sp. U1-2]MBP2832920.1 hypothetical protein [Aquimarina sp. U1-2]
MNAQIFDRLYDQSCKLYTIGKAIDTHGFSSKFKLLKLKLMYYGETIVQKLRNYVYAPDKDIETVCLPVLNSSKTITRPERNISDAITEIIQDLNRIITQYVVPSSICKIVIKLTKICCIHLHIDIPKSLLNN